MIFTERSTLFTLELCSFLINIPVKNMSLILPLFKTVPEKLHRFPLNRYLDLFYFRATFRTFSNFADICFDFGCHNLFFFPWSLSLDEIYYFLFFTLLIDNFFYLSVVSSRSCISNNFLSSSSTSKLRSWAFAKITFINLCPLYKASSLPEERYSFFRAVLGQFTVISFQPFTVAMAVLDYSFKNFLRVTHSKAAAKKCFFVKCFKNFNCQFIFRLNKKRLRNLLYKI